MRDQPASPSFPDVDDLPEVLDEVPPVPAATPGPTAAGAEPVAVDSPAAAGSAHEPLASVEPPPTTQDLSADVPDVPEVPVVPEVPEVPSALDGPDRPEVEVQGHLELLHEGRARGWATAAVGGVDHPVLDVRLVTEDEHVLATGTATDFRQDVADAGLGSGWCGFDLVLPGSLHDVPAGAPLRLQVEVEGRWTTASTTLAPEVRSAGRLEPVRLLATFAQAQDSWSRVPAGGVAFGPGVWIEPGSQAAGSVVAGLELITPSATSSRTPALRLLPDPGSEGRLDVRMSLGPHAESVRGGWVALPVHNRGAALCAVRLLLRTHQGRHGLGEFVVPARGTALLRVQVPDHDCDPAAHAFGHDAPGADDLWLELILDAGAALDVEAPLLLPDAGPASYESLAVELQRELLDGTEPVVAGGAPFTVVVPFHGQVALTVACATSVLTCSWAPVDLVLVDDGSPHPSTVDRLLAPVMATGRATLVRSDVNLGYTASVNRGVEEARTDVVVILNNDTRVTPGWDVPLRAALEDDRVFAAGPLSNAASYQSVPELRSEGAWAINRLAPGVTPVRLAAELRARFAGVSLPLAVLNGFCYAVRRTRFLEVGGLDEQAFPQGYGEEVDLMLRARSRGLRSVVTPDSFVYHDKSRTFGDRRAALSKDGGAAVRERWGPELDEAVRSMDEDAAFDAVRAEVSRLLAALASGGGHG